MKTTIDKVGRVVIPKAIRESARLEPGSDVEIRAVGDHVEIEAAPRTVRLERRGDLLVAVPTEEVEKLTVSEVESTMTTLREERRKQ
jgi:AbrB family looped-hinge helix DNA binding protein